MYLTFLNSIYFPPYTVLAGLQGLIVLLPDTVLRKCTMSFSSSYYPIWSFYISTDNVQQQKGAWLKTKFGMLCSQISYQKLLAMKLSRALGLCSAQTAILRKQDFRLTWSVVVKWCRAMIGHSEGWGKVKGCLARAFRRVLCLTGRVVYLLSLHPHLGAFDRPDQRSGGSDRRPPLSVWADVGNTYMGNILVFFGFSIFLN